MTESSFEKNTIKKYNFIGISISAFSKEQLIDYIKKTVEECNKKILYGYSLSIFRSCKDCPERIEYAEKSDVIVTDGRLLYLMAKRHGLPLDYDISIPKLVLLTLKLADENKWNVFLLGAEDYENKLAQKKVAKKYPNIINIDGRNGFFDEKNFFNIIKKINSTKSQIVLIGMPSPQKEKIALELKNQSNANIIIPCGGMLNVLAEKNHITPQWIKNLGLASLYRLLQEPHRLFGRVFGLYFFMLINFFPQYFYHGIWKKNTKWTFY